MPVPPPMTACLWTRAISLAHAYQRILEAVQPLVVVEFREQGQQRWLARVRNQYFEGTGFIETIPDAKRHATWAERQP